MAETRPASKKDRQPAVALTKGPELPWAPVLAGQAGSVPIVFTRDGDFFFVAAATAIRVYATRSGKLVSTLSSSSTASPDANASTSTSAKRSLSGNAHYHTAKITGLLLNPRNPTQLISSSLDGTIKVWDFFDAQLIRSLYLGFPVTNICAHPALSGQAMISLRKPKGKHGKQAKLNPFTYKGSTNDVIHLVSLKTGSLERIGKVRIATDMAVSADGKFGVIVGKRKIHIAYLDEQVRRREGADRSGQLTKFLTDRDITSLALHPQTNTFATGHENGQIRVWYFLNDETATKKYANGLHLAPNSMMHWHAHAVSALRFSENGALLLSGGEESTLVVWQLATKGREYVPRLGGSTIMSVSIVNDRQEELVCAMEDGSVVFIGTLNFKVTRTLSGVLANSSLRQTLSKQASALDAERIPLDIEPSNGDLVTMAGYPSALQFLAVETDDSQTMQLDVVPTNRISRPDQAPLENARVEHVRFCNFARRGRHERWMATVDRRASGEVTLKFWLWDQGLSAYVVNTRIEEPHGQNAHVMAMSFSPRSYELIGSSSDAGSPLLMTLGSDNKCRTWRLISTQGQKGKKAEVYWLARSAIEYRQQTLRDLAFSKDGSVFALVHARTVSLWDPESNAQLHSIQLGSLVSETGPSHLLFIGNGGGRYLAIADRQTLLLYDIISNTVAYRIAVAQQIVGLAPLTNDRFALITSSSTSTEESWVFVFSTRSSKALQQFTLSFGIQKVIGGPTSETGGSHAEGSKDQHEQPEWTLYALTSDFDVVRLGSTIERAATSTQQGRQAQSLESSARRARQLQRTVYDELLGTENVMQIDQRQTTESSAKPLSTDGARSTDKKGDTSSLLSMPAHLLPPVHLLFDSFLAEMLPPRPKDSDFVHGAQEEDEGEEEAEQERDEQKGVSLANEAPLADRVARIASLDMAKVSDMFAKMSSSTNDRTDESAGSRKAAVVNGKLSNNGRSPGASHNASLPSPVANVPAKKKKSRQSNGIVENGDLTPPSPVKEVGKKRKSIV